MRQLSCQGRFGCYSFFRILVLFPSRHACRHLPLNCETFSFRLLLFLVQDVFCSSSLRPACTIKFLPQIFLWLFETSGFTFQLFFPTSCKTRLKKDSTFLSKKLHRRDFFFILLSLFSDQKRISSKKFRRNSSFAEKKKRCKSDFRTCGV